MLSIEVNRWNATKNIIQNSTVSLDASMTIFVTSAIKPPKNYIRATQNGITD